MQKLLNNASAFYAALQQVPTESRQKRVNAADGAFARSLNRRHFGGHGAMLRRNIIYLETARY
jgi:hypothetical protein